MVVLRALTWFAALISQSHAELDDVYAPFFGNKLDVKACEGHPHGCSKLMKKMMKMEEEIIKLKGPSEKKEAKKEKDRGAKAPSPTGKPVELTDANFSDFVKGSEYPSLVLFHAPWCGHCKNMMPDYNKLAGVMAEKTVNIIRVDATENQQMASKFKVQGFPTLIFIPKGGKPMTYKYGRDLDAFSQFLEPYAKDRVVEKVELKQLSSQMQFDENCGNRSCMVTILPDLIDGGQAKGRKAALSRLEEAANKNGKSLKNVPLLWMEAGTNMEWEEAVIGTLGYPVTMKVDSTAGTVMIHKKFNTDVKELETFFNKSSTGRVPVQSFRSSLPKLKTISAWDGKDVIIDDEL